MDTALGKLDGYEALSTVQDATEHAVRDGARLVVLPEAVGGRWELNSLYWASIDEKLRARGATALIGADQRIDAIRRVNGIFGVGKLHGLEVAQRIPVPLGMWAPWSATRHIVSDWDGTGIVDIGEHRAMVLICYEQFLAWPVLVSAARGADVILAVANVWWASDTSIPAIQDATVRSWARLFNLSIVQAKNISQYHG